MTARGLLLLSLLLRSLGAAGLQQERHTAANQGSRPEADPDLVHMTLEWRQLDAMAAHSRHALCLDGTTPGFFYKAAAPGSEDMWVLQFMGGGWCSNAEDCEKRKFMAAGTAAKNPTMQSFFAPTEVEPFNSFNQVMFWYCDGGLWAGSRPEPIQTPSGPIFMQGKNILALQLDTLLQPPYTLSSAKQVLVTGGSAGGWATFMHADYLASRMPASVTKFLAAPASGWWAGVPGKMGSTDFMGSMVDFNELHTPSHAGPPACLEQLSPEDRWRCMFSDIAYSYSKTPMFVMQVTDHFIAMQNTTSVPLAGKNMRCVNFGLNAAACTPEDVSRLNGLLSNFVENLRGKDKFHRAGEGFFLTSCGEHGFYRSANFRKYSNNGLSVMKALQRWWNSDGSSAPATYLPCAFNDKPPYQCEASCVDEAEGASSGMN